MFGSFQVAHGRNVDANGLSCLPDGGPSLNLNGAIVYCKFYHKCFKSQKTEDWSLKS